MKKITKGTFLLAAGLWCLLFTGCPQNPEPKETIEFENKNFEVVFYDDFSNAETSKMNCYQLREEMEKDYREEIFTPDVYKDRLGFEPDENDVVVEVSNNKENPTRYVENGVLHLKDYFRADKDKNEAGGKTYRCAGNTVALGNGNFIKKGSYVEVKFKSPKSPGFDLSIFGLDLNRIYGKPEPTYNSKNYNIAEFDFVELITAENNNYEYVVPRINTVVYDKDGNRDNSGFLFNETMQRKVDPNTWYDEWHTLIGVVAEDGNSFTTYLDGTKVGTHDSSKWGGIEDGEMGLLILVDMWAGGWGNPLDLSYEGDYDFQIDYVKIAQLVK